MKVAFRTNLGSMDAKRLNLNHTECTVGKEVDVSKEVAEELKRMGVAVDADDAEDEPLIQSARDEEQRQEELRGVARNSEVRGVRDNPGRATTEVKGIKNDPKRNLDRPEEGVK